MKKTNFFKLLTVGVAALSLGFASCNYAKEADFKALCDDVETLQNDLKELQAQVDGLKYVVSVVETPAGSGIWLVTDSANQTVTIKTGTPQGPVASGTLSVGDNGNWFIGETDTQVKANATMPRIGTEGDQKYWEFPVINEGKVEWVKGAAAVAYTYAVNNGGQWSLWVPTKDNTSTLQEIKLPGASAGLGKIDIIGWVDGYAAADKNLASNPGGVFERDTEYDGTKPAPSAVALRDEADDTFVVYYNWINRFYTDTNNISFSQTGSWAERNEFTGSTDNTDDTALAEYGGYAFSAPGKVPEATGKYVYGNIYAPGDLKGTDYEWHVNASPAENFGAVDVKRHDVITAMDADNKGLVVQVHPLTANIENETFVLQDSYGHELPIKFKKPVLITGIMTRAENSGLWFIEGEAYAGNYPGNNGRTDFTKQFTKNTVWSLVNSNGIRSEYPAFTVTPSYILSRENQLDGIKDGDVPSNFGRTAADLTDLDPKAPPKYAYAVHTGKLILPTFEAATIRKGDGSAIANAEAKYAAEISDVAPFDVLKPDVNGFSDGAGYTTNTVIDWYFKVGSNEQSESWITTNFGLEYNADHTGFTVTRTPDELTRASFWMDLYKLGIDGVIYLERIPIYVVRKDVETVYTKTYEIQDEYPDAGPLNNDYLSQKITIDLADMFTTLGNEADGTQGLSNMRERWQDETYGARSFSVTGLTIEDQTGDQLGRFMFPKRITTTTVGANGTFTASDESTAAGSKIGNNATTAVTGTADDENNAAALNTLAPYNSGGAKAAQGNVGQSLHAFGATATGILFKGASGQSFDGLYDARTIELYPNYAYNLEGSGNVPSFVRGKKHTFTVQFFDRDDLYLNTIKIEVTPDIPVLDNLFVKDTNRWNADQSVLNAYYATPLGNWAEPKFYGRTGETSEWLTEANSIGAQAMLLPGATEPIVRTSTYYNVYNPGGTTTMTHSQYRPLDGGYLKVGERTYSAADKQWLDYTSVLLNTATGAKLENVLYTDLIKTPQSYNVNAANISATAKFSSNTMVQLTGQTNNVDATGIALDPAYTGIPKSDTGNAYGDEVPMKWDMGKYIHYYTYSNDEKKANDFKIKIMSALAEGKIVSSGKPVENQGSMPMRITKDFIHMEDYATNRREVFKTALNGSTPVYAYNYIAKVWFTRPDGVATYDLVNTGAENATQVNTGTTGVNAVATETAAGSGVWEIKDANAAFLPIRTVNSTFAGDLNVNVTVYDRFGRTLEGVATINVTNNVQE